MLLLCICWWKWCEVDPKRLLLLLELVELLSGLGVAIVVLGSQRWHRDPHPGRAATRGRCGARSSGWGSGPWAHRGEENSSFCVVFVFYYCTRMKEDITCMFFFTCNFDLHRFIRIFKIQFAQKECLVFMYCIVLYMYCKRYRLTLMQNIAYDHCNQVAMGCS